PVLRSGYLLYFLPVNFLKIARVLGQLPPDELVSGKVRVLDLGSGPGTSALGVMAFYADLLAKKKIKDAWLDFTLLDLNFNILKDARALHDAYAQELSKQPGFHSLCSAKNFDFTRGGMGRFLRNFKYHLVILSNVINEFRSREAAADLIEEILTHHLDPKGKIVIIEPALQKTSQDLQHLRDEIVVNRKKGMVLAPCLHQEECPLNVVNIRDWCHFYLPWECPPIIEKTDKLIGNRKEWLQLSYLVLGKNVPERSPSTWRVISNPMPSKGKKELVLCGPPGRYHITRLDKNATATNRIFDEIKRGDLIELDIGPPAPYRVDGEFAVTDKTRLKIISRT
ncbi:MAG: small ribosomal subunit Rsm22 family protein, partial [Deltaproteobacteria bacterium]|nr:small ribosomal subunit Rsm22 family protein [Deltaproteobacteria bacterium]